MLGIGRTQAASLAELVARKKYAKAIELIREDLKGRRREPRLRLQLADLLALSNRPKEAIPILMELADDFALSGSAAKAIVVLKKAQALDPGLPEVEERLAYLIARQRAPMPDPWARSRAALGREAAARPAPAEPAPSFPGDLEEIPTEPPTSSGVPEPAPSGAPEAVAPEVSDDGFRREVIALVEDVFSGRAQPESSELSALPAVQTPLFRDFTCEELAEVIRGLRLRVFEPGEVLVTEGEPGDSLFVLTNGSVRTYVRDAGGRNAPVRMLQEGDFFGEVCLLEDARRTATITAASRCELLEIDQATLHTITRTHPRIWDVIRRFYQQRSGSSAELAARGGVGPVPGA
jgi:hypothetical protein